MEYSKAHDNCEMSGDAWGGVKFIFCVAAVFAITVWNVSKSY